MSSTYSYPPPMPLGTALAQARAYRANPSITNRTARGMVALLREIERLEAALADALKAGRK